MSDCESFNHRELVKVIAERDALKARLERADRWESQDQMRINTICEQRDKWRGVAAELAETLQEIVWHPCDTSSHEIDSKDALAAYHTATGEKGAV